MNSKDINSQKLPHVYRSEGKDCYLDPIREKLICVTPEETVRQKVISYLLKVMKIPKQMLDVEAALVDYEVKSPRRADILILNEDEEARYPIAVIECKAPEVAIDDRGVEQVWDYCRKLNAEYAVITNSYDFRFYHYDGDDFEEMDDLPDYEEMLEGEVYDFTPPKPFRRIPFNKISFFVDKMEEYNEFLAFYSSATIKKIAVNLYECFMETDHKMPTGKYKLFTLLEDYGVRNLTYGNNSGGNYNGNYRSFLIKYHRSIEFVSFGILAFGDDETILCIAIDDDKSPHHSLQQSLGKNLVVDGRTVRFYHNGAIAVGNIGSGKVADLRKVVKRRYSQILGEKGFNLGELEFNRQWRFDDEEVIEWAENMISYALIRDEFRNILKNQKLQNT